MNDIYQGLYKYTNKLITDRISKRFQADLLIAHMQLKDIERYEHETDNSIKWIYENKVHHNKNPYLITKDTLQRIDNKLLKKLSDYKPFYSTFNFVMGLPADIFRIGYTSLCNYFSKIKEKNDQYLYHNKWFILLNCLFSGNSLLLADNYFNISNKLKGTKFENRWNAYLRNANEINPTNFFLDSKRLPFDKNYMLLFVYWGLYLTISVEDYFKNQYDQAIQLKEKSCDYETGIHNIEFNIYKKMGKSFFKPLTESMLFFDAKIVKKTPGYTVWILTHNLNYALTNFPNDDDLILKKLKKIGHYISIGSKLNTAPIFNENLVQSILSYNIDFLLNCSKKELNSLIKSLDFSELYDADNENPRLRTIHQDPFFQGKLTEKENQTRFKHYNKAQLRELCLLNNIDISQLKNKKQLCQALYKYFSN